jgi:hypothetical protein
MGGVSTRPDAPWRDVRTKSVGWLELWIEPGSCLAGRGENPAEEPEMGAGRDGCAQGQAKWWRCLILDKSGAGPRVCDGQSARRGAKGGTQAWGSEWSVGAV